VARETSQPLVGAIIGSRLQFSELGLYGRYVTSGTTLQESLKRASRAIKYHETGSRLICGVKRNSLRVKYHPPTPKALGSWHQSDGVASMLINLVRAFEGPEWRPTHLGLAAARGERLVRLEEFFDVPIVDIREGTELTGRLSSKIICRNAPNSVNKPMSWSEIRDMVAARPPQTFKHTLKQLMLSLTCGGLFELKDVSDYIGIGARTIQRRLKVEGTNFGEVLREIRQAFAEEQLLCSEKTIEKIGESLGYSSKHHFIRAFKNWHSITPGAYRTTNKN
jgi:AraC-like DNA-binding protein